MANPTKPDWRRMPASAVPVKEAGPEFVRLRAEDSARYADECEQHLEDQEQRALAARRTAIAARDDADRWALAAAAFTAAWPTEEPGR